MRIYKESRNPRLPNIPPAMKCPYCGDNAVRTTGRTIYPHIRSLWEKRYYLCAPCKAHVGCHEGTWNPLGRLAKKELRKLKMQAHEFFDQIWLAGEMDRNEAYAWLAEKMGLPGNKTHIGFFDEQQCRQVIEICTERRKNGLRSLLRES